MTKTITITLSGNDYVVPKFNLSQLETVVSEIFQMPQAKVPFAVVRLALTRADPQVDAEALEPDADEVVVAAKSILVAAGLS